MSRRVLIIGASLAGLIAALRLTARGFSVTVLEDITDQSSTTSHTIPTIDQSDEVWSHLPFVLQGVQNATYSLFRELGISFQLRKAPKAHLDFLISPGRRARFRILWAPSPFHTLSGIALFQGFSVADRWRLLNFIERSWETDEGLAGELHAQSADSWLKSIGQNEQVRTSMWGPLCRFLLGDTLTTASAESFRLTLMQCFFSKRQDSIPIIPMFSIRSLLLEPLKQRLELLGVTFQSNQKVIALQCNERAATRLQIHGGQVLYADVYVTALSPHCLISILPERLLARFAYFHNLTELHENPVVVVTLRLKKTAHISSLFLSNGTFHWITIRDEFTKNGKIAVISCVSIGSLELLSRSDEELIDQALAELHEGFPSLVKRDNPSFVSEPSICRNSRAWLSSRPGTWSHRPLSQSPLQNLFLTGGWTDTGLTPSCLESVIVSGDRCAQAISQKDC